MNGLHKGSTILRSILNATNPILRILKRIRFGARKSEPAESHARVKVKCKGSNLVKFKDVITWAQVNPFFQFKCSLPPPRVQKIFFCIAHSLNLSLIQTLNA